MVMSESIQQWFRVNFRRVDFINLMTYDFHGAWENVTGHNSPLYSHPSETGDSKYLNVVSETVHRSLHSQTSETGDNKYLNVVSEIVHLPLYSHPSETGTSIPT